MEMRFPLILDGATGTQLQKRGYQGDVSAEQWVLDHPDSIQDIQRRYVQAGSRVVYAPTFGANRQKLEERGVTVAEWVFLRALFDAPQGAAPSALAQSMGATRGAITKLADRLIDKHLVSRTASESDGRAQTLSLTPAGRRLVPVLAGLADENDAECFATLSQRDRHTLLRVLQALAQQHHLASAPLA